MFISTNPTPGNEAAFAAYIDSQRAHWGFVPDYTGCFASSPDVATAWIALASAVRTTMERRRFELVTIAAARARGSAYCTAAHAKMLMTVGDEEPTLRELARHPDGSCLSAVDAAVYRFATRVATAPASVSQHDIDGLRSLGLADSDIADIGYAVGVRLFFATVLDALGARLDPELVADLDPELLAFVRGSAAAL
ncbi:MAG TPA: carboxymuconolactone decarboxylase family protein [Dermatophilaceae bacterium]|nr:carboxymuconolactone decarboxylase family protein [Dermatophilaceae bacterium]